MSASNRDERLADLDGLVACLKEAFEAEDVETLYELIDQLDDVIFDLKSEVTKMDDPEEDAE